MSVMIYSIGFEKGSLKQETSESMARYFHRMTLTLALTFPCATFEQKWINVCLWVLKEEKYRYFS